jgi:hypothetical protein
VNQLASDHNEAKRFYRFLKHQKVDIEELLYDSCTIRSSQLAGRHLLVLGDSTSFTLHSHIDRIQDSSRIGVIEGNRTRGFLAHAQLGVDALSGDIVGMADALFWSRTQVKQKRKASPNWKDRESYKWALGMRNASKVLKAAEVQTYVFDRDADHLNMYEYATALSEELGIELHLVIRRAHNRFLLWKGEKMLINQILAQAEIAGTYELTLPKLNHYSSTRGKQIRRQARQALMQVRLAAVEIPVDSANTRPLWLVQAKEITPDLQPGEKPVDWVLLTTHSTENFIQAQQIIRYYTLRWIIEQWFRTMKAEGLQLEETELTTFDAILRQTVMAFKAAARILQLVYARNRFDAQPIEDVWNQQEQVVLEKLNQQLEGATQKQQNPFPKNKLSWAVWVIARLGGWKGYQSQRPPGPITLKRGLQKFDIYLKAFFLFNPPDG